MQLLPVRRPQSCGVNTLFRLMGLPLIWMTPLGPTPFLVLQGNILAKVPFDK